MTLTIDLTPAEELGLFEVARQQGLLPTEAAHRLLTAQLPRVPLWEQEQGLVQEYQALTTQERHGQLTEAQFVRLREVTAALDELEAHDPVEQEAERRVKETSDKLDQMLLLLRNLPRKTAELGTSGWNQSAGFP